MSSKTTTFLHSGNVGDVWASLPAVREFCRKMNKKAIYYFVIDANATYYEGAVHPTKNEKGEDVMLNAKMVEMMIPLLMEQPYIEHAAIWNNELFAIDMNMFRSTYVGMPSFSINRWYFYTWPDLACDLSKPWLTIPDSEKNLAKDRILINRTERYRNPNIHYSFLKPFEDDCLFVGTMREYNNFCMTHDLNIEKLHVNNFLEFAQAIKQSRFYIGNQSQGYQLCQGQFHPSILEISSIAPNVIPIGEKMYDFFAQNALEYYFHELNGGGLEFVAELKKRASEEAPIS